VIAQADCLLAELSDRMRSVQSIPIHTWGGFGSQLFALALHIDLLRERNLQTHLICHTSGITKRRAELAELCSSIPIEEIDDFTSSISPNNVSASKAKTTMRKIFDKTGIISESNTDKQYKDICSLVRQFRGHYSLRNIQHQTLLQMNEVLDLNYSNNFIKIREMHDDQQDSLSLHYRLGDLLSAKEKTFVEPTRILNVIQSKFITNLPATLRLSSDSVDEATKLLSSVGGKRLDWETSAGNSLDVISQLQCAKTFIGTNSKLSLWIVLVRLHFSDSKANWLPSEMYNSVKKNLNDMSWSHRISFY